LRNNAGGTALVDERMALFSKKEAVGLDIGHGAVKAVHLLHTGKELRIKRTITLDASLEGILDEEELHTSMLAWLEENGLKQRPFTVGIPQYLATTQVSDFPAGVRGLELEGMVSFETMQLAGLSDEAFSSDFHVMPPNFGRQNPVLIGVCRQSVIDERMSRLTREGLQVVDLGMNGIAIANAFFHLHPDALEEERPSILLDIGEDNATLLVIAGGQVLFTGSLLFGASRYTEALSSHLGCSMEEADRRKRDLILDPDIPEHPLHPVTEQLVGEMRNAIEHWRSGEKEELAHLMLGKIWITGGGAALEGLAGCLGRHFGCEVAVFGPTDEEIGLPSPALSAAFGLALHSLGLGHFSISLAPATLRWQQRRKRLFPYLLAAEVICLALLAFGLVRYYSGLSVKQRVLERRLDDLNTCKSLIPQLEKEVASVEHYEKMLIPFAEKGNRARRYLLTLQELARARGSKDFFIYLADRLTYDEERPKEKDAAAAASPSPRRAMPAGPTMFSSVREARNTQTGPVLDATLVDKIPQLKSMVVAGYTPYRVTDRYKSLLELVAKLNQGDVFKGVDSLTESERAGMEERIFTVWARFWTAKPFKGRYTPFMFDMPFASLDVDASALAPESADGSH
jgi:type IV pilus assembly protein PilM